MHALSEITPRIDTRVAPHLRIINGALDEDPTSPENIILQGRIDPSTLRFLKVDDYQRQLRDRGDIFEALKSGITLPNIEIGVRGSDYLTDGDDFIISCPAYIVDGWQRVGNALRFMELIPEIGVRLYGSIHFGTTQAWEASRFTELNKNVSRVSPNLHLKNMRAGNDALLALFALSFSDPGFPLYKKVSWAQSMGRGELLTALSLCKTMMILHSHHTGIAGYQAETAAAALAKTVKLVTLPVFRRNVVTFFNVVNDAWPISKLEYRTAATQIKGAFLFELARMFSRHPAFWDSSDTILQISADDRRKLAKFPISDPQIVTLAGSPGAARKMLYELMIRHMNSGRRTQRLFER